MSHDRPLHLLALVQLTLGLWMLGVGAMRHTVRRLVMGAVVAAVALTLWR